MSKEVEEAKYRLKRANEDLIYATFYSQEEQDKDIETILKYIEELEKKNNILKGDMIEILNERKFELHQRYIDFNKDNTCRRLQELLQEK